MAKKSAKAEQVVENIEQPVSTEMTVEEARAYRASKFKPSSKSVSAEEAKEQFRVFWAQERSSYEASKDLEEILWAHLKSIKKDEPSKFQDGIAHFGLKKIK